jgi:hypothetical protein
MDLFIRLLPKFTSHVLDAGSPSGGDAGLLTRREQNVTRIDAATVSTGNLTFEDASVTGIWCDEALSPFGRNQISASLREFSRVLVPHGGLFISLRQAESADGCGSYGAQASVPEAQQLIRDLIRAAGFNPVKIYVTDQHAESRSSGSASYVCALAKNRGECCSEGDKRFYDRNAF